MEIRLENLDDGHLLRVAGPRVDVSMQDDGQAIVTMTLSIGDGTHFHYPDGSATGSSQSTTLAPGRHDAVLRISALKMERFGRSYDSVVRIDGQVIARARGVVPDDAQEDSDFQFIVLRVGDFARGSLA